MPLIAKASGTNVAGATFCSPRELAITSRIDTTAVPITIVGSVVTSRFARYSASRVALPAMNCALTAAEQIIAMMTAGSDRVGDDLIRTVGVRGMRDVGALEPLAARRTRSWYHPPPPRLRRGLVRIPFQDAAVATRSAKSSEITPGTVAGRWESRVRRPPGHGAILAMGALHGSGQVWRALDSGGSRSVAAPACRISRKWPSFAGRHAVAR